jgi:ribosome modulation factor
VTNSVGVEREGNKRQDDPPFTSIHTSLVRHWLYMSLGVSCCNIGKLNYEKLRLENATAVGYVGATMASSASVCSYKRIKDRIGWEDIDGA